MSLEVNPLQVNCIGLGHWGPNLVRTVSEYPHAVVRTICDVNEQRLKEIVTRFPGIGEITTDTAKTIKDPHAHAVVIATPTWTHYELTKTALLAGKHVLVEKPMTDRLDQAEELFEIATRLGLTLAVGHVFLFNPGVITVKSLIQSGELGPIQYIQSTRTNLGPFRTDCNALWDLASHDISIINDWLDDLPDSVTAFGKSYLSPPIEDVVTASFNYPGGVMASIHASWLNPCKVRQIVVMGEKRMVVFDDMNSEHPVTVHNKSAEWLKNPVFANTISEFRSAIPQPEFFFPVVDQSEPLLNQVHHFLDSLIQGVRPRNCADLGLNVVRCLDAAERSMKSQSTMMSITR